MTTPTETAALARIAVSASEADLRTYLKNARGRSDEVYRAAFARLVAISAIDEADPVTKACWEMVHAIEEVRRQAGRKVWKMNRLRPKIACDGAAAALEYCALNETEGFAEIIGYGLPEYTVEAIVLGFPAMFPSDRTRMAVRERLRAAGVDPSGFERG